MVPDTETKMSSFWRNFNHWLHWKLSFWQLPVQPVMKISSKWWHFRFSGIAWMRYPFNMSRHGDTHCVGGAAHHWCIDLAPNRWQAITWTQWWGLLSNSNKEQTSVKAPVKIQSKYNIHLRNYLNISPAKWACYISYACHFIFIKRRHVCMKVTQCIQYMQQIWWQTLTTPHLGLRVFDPYDKRNYGNRAVALTCSLVLRYTIDHIDTGVAHWRLIIDVIDCDVKLRCGSVAVRVSHVDDKGQKWRVPSVVIQLLGSVDNPRCRVQAE